MPSTETLFRKYRRHEKRWLTSAHTHTHTHTLYTTHLLPLCIFLELLDVRLVLCNLPMEKSHYSISPHLLRDRQILGTNVSVEYRSEGTVAWNNTEHCNTAWNNTEHCMVTLALFHLLCPIHAIRPSYVLILSLSHH